MEETNHKQAQEQEEHGKKQEQEEHNENGEEEEEHDEKEEEDQEEDLKKNPDYNFFTELLKGDKKHVITYKVINKQLWIKANDFTKIFNIGEKQIRGHIRDLPKKWHCIIKTQYNDTMQDAVFISTKCAVFIINKLPSEKHSYVMKVQIKIVKKLFDKCPQCDLFYTGGRICSYCVPLAKNKLYRKTKEMKVVRYLREQLPYHNFIHNKSVGSHCTKHDKEDSNGHLFPDILFDRHWYFLIVEVDEFQHKSTKYSCEKQRMLNIAAKVGLPTIFIRYNPDNKDSCLKVLLAEINKYLDLDIENNKKDQIWDDHGLKVIYLFYK